MNINVFTDHPIYNNRLHLTIAENSWVHFIFIKHTPRGKPTRWILFHSIDKEATSCHVMHIHLQYNSTFKAGALNLSLSVFLTCTLSPHSSPFLSFFSFTLKAGSLNLSLSVFLTCTPSHPLSPLILHSSLSSLQSHYFISW